MVGSACPLQAATSSDSTAAAPRGTVHTLHSPEVQLGAPGSFLTAPSELPAQLHMWLLLKMSSVEPNLPV